MNAGLGEDTKATTGSEFDDIITTYPESDATNSDTELREDSDADILMSERHDSGTVDVAEPKTSLGTEGRVSVKGSNKTYHVSIDAVPQPGSKKENKDSFSNVHNNNSGEADRRLEYGGESSIVIGADAGKDKGWGISEIV